VLQRLFELLERLIIKIKRYLESYWEGFWLIFRLVQLWKGRRDGRKER